MAYFLVLAEINDCNSFLREVKLGFIGGDAKPPAVITKNRESQSNLVCKKHVGEKRHLYTSYTKTLIRQKQRLFNWLLDCWLSDRLLTIYLLINFFGFLVIAFAPLYLPWLIRVVLRPVFLWCNH